MSHAPASREGAEQIADDPHQCWVRRGDIKFDEDVTRLVLGKVLMTTPIRLRI